MLPRVLSRGRVETLMQSNNILYFAINGRGKDKEKETRNNVSSKALTIIFTSQVPGVNYWNENAVDHAPLLSALRFKFPLKSSRNFLLVNSESFPQF